MRNQPGDALNLKTANDKYVGFTNTTDCNITAPKMRFVVPDFELYANGKSYLHVVGSRVELLSPRTQTDVGGTLAAKELTPKWYVDAEVETLKTSTNSELDKKLEDANKNGKQYARKDGQLERGRHSGAKP